MEFEKLPFLNTIFVWNFFTSRKTKTKMKVIISRKKIKTVDFLLNKIIIKCINNEKKKEFTLSTMYNLIKPIFVYLLSSQQFAI